MCDGYLTTNNLFVGKYPILGNMHKMTDLISLSRRSQIKRHEHSLCSLFMTTKFYFTAMIESI